MPKKKIERLMSDLHEQFGGDLTSPQQQQLMEKMQHHLHRWGENEPLEPNFQESVELLLEDIKDKHPKAAAVIKEVLEVLNNIGI